MSLNLAKYDAKRYDDNDYNCLHFAVDIYRDITGKNMGVYVKSLMTGRNKRTIDIDKLKRFVLLAAPTQTCLALMHGGELHAGIYHQSKIIHITESGVQCVPPHIAELNHGKIKYYAVES